MKIRGPYTPLTPEEIEKELINRLYKRNHKIKEIANVVGRSQSFVWMVISEKKEVETGYFDVDKFVKESWYLNISE